jgi:hypothetical protein
VCYALITCQKRSPYAGERKEVAVLPFCLLMIFHTSNILPEGQHSVVHLLLSSFITGFSPDTSPLEPVVNPTTLFQDCNTSLVMYNVIQYSCFFFVGGAGYSI